MHGWVRRWMVGAVVAASVATGVGPMGLSSPVSAAPTEPASTPIGARVAWAQTNGDILTITKVAGVARDLIAFGGNFTAVITPDGVSRAARHFAVVDEFTGELVYAGNASSYVRSISSRDGVIYVGGDFTTFGGVARNRLAALSPTFTVTAWNPAPSFRVRAVVAGPAGVYYGGDGTSVRLANVATGGTIWSQPHTGGSVRALALSPDNGALYVGGLFETFGPITRHGLIRANPLTGSPDPVFNANFRPDSGIGANGNYDGEAGNVLQLTSDGSRLLVGVAGQGSDVFKVLNPVTGSLTWVKVLPGDCQGVAVVGSTYVVGYHRNRVNGAIPYPYYAAQLETTNSQLTTWDPGLTGLQSNADGGNNGVQAIYADPVNRRLFVAGAFTTENGRPLESLAGRRAQPAAGGVVLVVDERPDGNPERRRLVRPRRLDRIVVVDVRRRHVGHGRHRGAHLPGGRHVHGDAAGDRQPGRHGHPVGVGRREHRRVRHGGRLVHTHGLERVRHG
jgi:hypothetical protein